MAKIAVITKIIFIWVYNGFAGLVLGGTMQATKIKEVDLTTWFILSLCSFATSMIFLPEIFWLSSKSFRSWIKTGIEDGDGRLHKEDLKDGVILYVSLNCIRIYIGCGVAMGFGLDIDKTYYICALLGSFGIAGLTVIKSFVKG